MSTTDLDKTDRRILEELQKDGRLTNQEVADRVSLSPSPCLRRIRRLEKLGVIRQYVALVDSDCSPTSACSWRNEGRCRSTISRHACRPGRRWWPALR